MTQEKAKGYKKLIAWQRANELTFQIYLETKFFPKEELYGVSSQLRRASLSIPTNLAEGNGRQNSKERKQFFNIALGSLAEIEYLLEFCLRLGYLRLEKYEKLELLRGETGALLWRLYQSF